MTLISFISRLLLISRGLKSNGNQNSQRTFWYGKFLPRRCLTVPFQCFSLRFGRNEFFWFRYFFMDAIYVDVSFQSIFGFIYDNRNLSFARAIILLSIVTVDHFYLLLITFIIPLESIHDANCLSYIV